MCEPKVHAQSEQETGSFSSLALGQEVIKWDQTPGTPHGPEYEQLNVMGSRSLNNKSKP